MKPARLGSALLILTALLILPWAASSSFRWHEFRPEGGQFRAFFPGEPVYREGAYDGPFGQIKENIFEWKEHDLSLSLAYSDLPWIATVFGGRQLILRKAREALMEEEQAAELKRREIRLDKHHGVEVEYTMMPEESDVPMIARARLYLVGKRIFVIVASSPVLKPHYDPMNLFLTSFEPVES